MLHYQVRLQTILSLQNNSVTIKIISYFTRKYPNIVSPVNYCCNTYQYFSNDTMDECLSVLVLSVLCFDSCTNGTLFKFPGLSQQHRLMPQALYS